MRQPSHSPRREVLDEDRAGLPIDAARERYPPSIGGPRWVRIDGHRVVRESSNVASVRVHDPDLRVPRSIAAEDNSTGEVSRRGKLSLFAGAARQPPGCDRCCDKPSKSTPCEPAGHEREYGRATWPRDRRVHGATVLRCGPFVARGCCTGVDARAPARCPSRRGRRDERPRVPCSRTDGAAAELAPRPLAVLPTRRGPTSSRPLDRWSSTCRRHSRA